MLAKYTTNGRKMIVLRHYSWEHSPEPVASAHPQLFMNFI